MWWVWVLKQLFLGAGWNMLIYLAGNITGIKTLLGWHRC